MSNSSLVNHVRKSPNCSSRNGNRIDRITIHHMAGNLSVETCGNVFAPSSRQASSNYGIDSNGRVGLYVDEAYRSWCSSSKANDQRAVTIEVADNKIGGGWGCSSAAMAKLVLLCADICRRNGIKKLNYTGNTNGNLTLHKWFANTDCPGAYLESQMPVIAREVNKLLESGATTYTWGSTTASGGVSGSVSSVKPVQKPGNPVNDNMLYYRAHCQTAGTLAQVRDGQVAGTTGYGKRLEGFWIDLRKVREIYPNAKLSAKVHIQGIGWKRYDNVEHDTLLGTTGQSRRIEAVELELTGIRGKNIYIRTHLAGFGWTGWVAGGFTSGTIGIKKAIEAIQIKIA